MPTYINGKFTNLIFLDTNAISALLKLEEGYVEQFVNLYEMNYTPCFSVYNMFEVKKGYPERFQK